jgi:hypothetical protein
VKINPQRFFNFCAAHSGLLRALVEWEGEISESEGMRLVRSHPPAHEELPETAWRSLRELQILVATEPGSELYFLADPVARLLDYLYNAANPATPEMIRGYVMSLETSGKQLARALEEEEIQQVKLSFEEISQTLRRIHAGLDETHKAILAEVGRYKTERSRVPVREKYRRIVYWMERYIEPMIEIVRSDGTLRAAFDEVERLLARARGEALFNDLPALARNQRFLRLVGAYALRVFIQCRKEIQPLYESLRRSSFIAEGAAKALEKLQNDGLSKWGPEPLVPVFALRYQNVPGDAAIHLALRRVVEHRPEPPPVVAFAVEEQTPDALLRRMWLDALPERAREVAPIEDLLQWMVEQHPGKETSQVLAGFSTLLFHPAFETRFRDAERREYAAPDGALEACPVQLVPK